MRHGLALESRPQTSALTSDQRLDLRQLPCRPGYSCSVLCCRRYPCIRLCVYPSGSACRGLSVWIFRGRSVLQRPICLLLLLPICLAEAYLWLNLCAEEYVDLTHSFLVLSLYIHIFIVHSAIHPCVCVCVCVCVCLCVFHLDGIAGGGAEVNMGYIC